MTNPNYWKNLTAEDVPPGWIDNMVKRLFEELNRQLLRVERTSKQESDKKDARDNYPDDPVRRGSEAHTLSTLVRSMEKLTELETKRAAVRSTKATRKPKDVRKALAKQISEKLEPSAKTPDSERAE
jgi:hypothetical protein